MSSALGFPGDRARSFYILNCICTSIKEWNSYELDSALPEAPLEAVLDHRRPADRGRGRGPVYPHPGGGDAQRRHLRGLLRRHRPHRHTHGGSVRSGGRVRHPGGLRQCHPGRPGGQGHAGGHLRQVPEAVRLRLPAVRHRLHHHPHHLGHHHHPVRPHQHHSDGHSRTGDLRAGPGPHLWPGRPDGRDPADRGGRRPAAGLAHHGQCIPAVPEAPEAAGPDEHRPAGEHHRRACGPGLQQRGAGGGPDDLRLLRSRGHPSTCSCGSTR